MAKEKKSKRKIKPLSYFRESFQELKKVTWPTGKETLRLTIIVVIISAIVATFLGFFDFMFGEAINYLLER